MNDSTALPTNEPRERPSVVRYLAVILALGIPVLTVPGMTGLPAEPFILISVFVILLGGAVLTARRAGSGVRQLFDGALRWRIGWGTWGLVIGALPLATVAVAAATGTLTAPSRSWPATIGTYLFFTLIFGTLLLNLWEEVAWQGLVQRQLTRRHGLIGGAALTAIPFAALHVPLQLAGVTTAREAAFNVGQLLILALALRYLLGRTDHATGGSLLAVGVLHASFNASGQLDVLVGGWQHIAALAIIAVLVLLADGARSRLSASIRHSMHNTIPADGGMHAD